MGTYQCQADMDQMAQVLIFFFMCGVLVCFWYHGNAHLVECVWKSSAIFKFAQEFEKDKYLIFKCLKLHSPMKLSSTTLLFVGMFLITYSISLLVLVYSYFLFLYDSIGRLYVLENLSISSRLFSLLGYTVHSSLL